jgi:hypothetical protein
MAARIETKAALSALSVADWKAEGQQAERAAKRALTGKPTLQTRR